MKREDFETVSHLLRTPIHFDAELRVQSLVQHTPSSILQAALDAVLEKHKEAAGFPVETTSAMFDEDGDVACYFGEESFTPDEHLFASLGAQDALWPLIIEELQS